MITIPPGVRVLVATRPVGFRKGPLGRRVAIPRRAMRGVIARRRQAQRQRR